ncbi:MAG: HAD family hydrolase [Candidatus Eremiobacteraeota bacterium]|nr:HAD family hydrolase [Candidatus Eremiobacteraeota bacterium]
MQALAIGFDFDHTLGIDNQLEVDAFVRLAQQLAAVSGEKLDEEHARSAIARELENYRGGRSSLNDAILRALEDSLRTASDAANAVDVFRGLAVEMAPRYVQPLPGVPELLRSLDARMVPYAILSNGWNPLQQRKADCIGFTKPVFVSDDLGVRKPNVKAFQVLCGYFKLPAGSIWYVGDDPKVDIVGALSAGMKAIWFDWEGKKYPTDIPGPTAIVQHIVDVLKYLS